MKNKILKIVTLTFFIFFLYFFTCNISRGYEFENELKGSTGWGTVDLSIRESPNNSSKSVATVPKGEAFLIISESGNYWQIIYNNSKGYVEHSYCMINLPDVMPSIMYNISNASSSIYKSSGVDLPDITGKQLYNTGKVMNNKIGRQEYPCPILYSTAKKIALAQNKALKEGYCLKIYDSYRPRNVSNLIAQKLNIIYNQNPTVKNNIDYSVGASGTKYSWGQSWFLAQSLSSHNTGAAIDVTLCNKSTKKECTMPTVMHELSTKAIKYYSGSCSKVPANYSKEMTNDAKKLDEYMTSVGMTTLSSEWWHFQEQDGYNRIRNLTNSNGCNFQIKNIVSESSTSQEEEEKRKQEEEEKRKQEEEEKRKQEEEEKRKQEEEEKRKQEEEEKRKQEEEEKKKQEEEEKKKQEEEEKKKFIKGDPNGDGSINVFDISLMIKYMIKEEKFNDVQKQAADVNSDGTVSVIDISQIIKYLIKEIDSFE